MSPSAEAGGGERLSNHNNILRIIGALGIAAIVTTGLKLAQKLNRHERKIPDTNGQAWRELSHSNEDAATD